MKNIFVALLLGIATILQPAAGMAAPVSPSPEQKVLLTAGEITAIGENTVTISGKGAHEKVILHIQSGTHIRNGAAGEKLLLSALKPGDRIVAYYGSALTKSLPPQGRALALITGDLGGDTGKYLQVESVEATKDGGIRVLSNNKDQLITLRPDVLPSIADIKPGSELLVWYDFMALSMPGQAGATKAVLLPPAYDLRVHTLAGVIVARDHELPLGSNDLILARDQTVLLPLRVVAENLGYTVLWFGESATIELRDGNRTAASMNIGSNLYTSRGKQVKLAHPPEMVTGTTLVPVEFFTNILQLKVEINTGHI